MGEGRKRVGIIYDSGCLACQDSPCTLRSGIWMRLASSSRILPVGFLFFAKNVSRWRSCSGLHLFLFLRIADCCWPDAEVNRE